MNNQERERLNRFLQELVQARVAARDVEAERLIRENCNYQPDANYLLVQRALIVEDALKAAQAENTELRAEIDRLRGSAPRVAQDNAWGNTRPAASAASAPAAPAGRGSALLGGIAGTAAGVVAGSLLFNGVGQMLGGARDPGFVDGHTAAARTRAEPVAGENGELGDFAALLPSDADLDAI